MSKPFYVSNKELQSEYVNWFIAIEDAKEKGKDEPPIPPAIVDAIIKITTKLSYSSEFINYSFREDLIGDAQYDCIKFVKKYNPNKILHKIIIKPISGMIKVKDDLVGETSEIRGKVKYKNDKTGLISMLMYDGTDFTQGEIVKSTNGSAIVEKIATHNADNPFSYITTIAYNAFLRRIDTEKTESYVKAMILSNTPIHEFYDSIDHDDVENLSSIREFLMENSDALSNNEPMAVKRKKRKLKLELPEEIVKCDSTMEDMFGDE